MDDRRSYLQVVDTRNTPGTSQLTTEISVTGCALPGVLLRGDALGGESFSGRTGGWVPGPMRTHAPRT